MRVRNLTPDRLQNVVVTETFPPNGAELKASAPQAEFGKGENAVWMLGELEGGATRTIRVAAVVHGAGDIGQCTDVTYDQSLCTHTHAVSPRLELNLSMPSVVTTCEPIPVRLLVRNTGTGPARGVLVRHTLPEGLTSERGSTVAFRLESIPGGQARELRFTARPQRAGTFPNRAVASAADVLKSESSATVRVVQPEVTVNKTGPETVMIGRTARYAVTVANPGDASLSNVVVRDPVPEGVRLLKASSGGRVVDGVLIWAMEELEPGRQRVFHADYKAVAAGTVANTVRVEATCARPAVARATTEIRGIPAILLEVVDRNDPVAIGETEVYVITATNQGSATGTNIAITCIFEENTQYVRAGGSTPAIETGRTVRFAPLPRLAPGAKAVWTVVGRAVKPGDTRFSVEMNSDQIQRPVRETESTQLY